MRLPAAFIGVLLAITPALASAQAQGPVYSVPVGNSPYRGPKHAPVTMVMGCQYFGPYCNKVRSTLDVLRKRYGKNLKIVYKHFRIHRQRATPAALAACAAHRQGEFFKMDRAIWTQAYPRQTYDERSLFRLASSLGLDMGQYGIDTSTTCAAEVAADEALLRSRGVRGTPAFFINGVHISGARPLASFTAIIDAQLSLARTRIAAGTPLKDYYDIFVVRRGLKSAAAPSPSRPAPPPRPRGTAVYSVPVGASPTLGPSDAKVTMVVSVDFWSPFSKHLRPKLDTLARKYPTDLRIAFKHFVVYPQRSTDAALAACAAHRQGRFFDMERAIWRLQRNQRERVSLENEARALGLDMRKYRRDRARVCPGVIAADKAQLLRLGARGVPASYINGRFLSGDRSLAQFEQLIQQELRTANQRLSSGQATRRTYYREWVVRRGRQSK